MADVVGFTNDAISILDSIGRNILNNDVTDDILNASSNRLTSLLRNTRRMARRYEVFGELCGIPDIIEKMIQDIQHQQSELPSSMGLFRTQKLPTRGRPLYMITKEQLTYFLDVGFRRKEMAEMMHVSESVIKRRLRHFGLSIRGQYSQIPDTDLDVMVSEITADNENLGQRMVQGILTSRGIKVQRQRVADALIRVDESAVARRWCRSIHRRVYSVSGPNALWHIDGNHKLIRWDFVIHGGIDGYSRLVVFLNAATDNKSTSMTKAFLQGTQTYGVPSRVRSDHGLENTGVGAFMLGHRGPNRGSFITGKSTHNQRIERLWRDLFQSCTHVYHSLFFYMEESGILDLNDEIHVFCLHYIYLPRLQKSLQQFRAAWNAHKLRSEGGKSPQQLFLGGMIKGAGQGHTGIDDMFCEPDDVPLSVPEEDFGVDEDGPIITGQEESRTETSFNQPIPNEVFDQLRQNVDPLQRSGLDTEQFLQAVEICKT